jgi:hypothetical protein
MPGDIPTHTMPQHSRHQQATQDAAQRALLEAPLPSYWALTKQGAGLLNCDLGTPNACNSPEQGTSPTCAPPDCHTPAALEQINT